jgi:DNA-directed RNA polymerase subunit RPC12/RpoP
LREPDMLPTHDVDCPKCGRFVYTAISLEDVVAAGAPASPRVQSDAHGDYVRCPHCGLRIAMRRVSTAAGTGFRPA